MFTKKYDKNHFCYARQLLAPAEGGTLTDTEGRTEGRRTKTLVSNTRYKNGLKRVFLPDGLVQSSTKKLVGEMYFR